MSHSVPIEEQPLPPQSSDRLSRILASTVDSRLHLAVALVAHTSLPVAEILDLRWPQVSVTNGTLLTRQGVLRVSDALADLAYWHATRQRMDRYRCRRPWPVGERVIVDERGERYSLIRADNELALLCRRAGLPIMSLNALRHPVFGSVS